LPAPFVHLNHLDLLHISRKLWKKRLASRSLQDLEAEILKIPRDENEVPGWLIPEIYFDYQRTGDPSRLLGVMYHNRMDILSLAALMIYIGDALRLMDPLSSTIHPTDLYSMGVIYNDVGLDDQAESIFLACRKIDGLDELYLPDLLQRLGLIYKRRADWVRAVEAWEAAIKLRDINAALELAKYYEHQESDYPRALFWTQTASSFVEPSSMQHYQLRKTQMEFTKREQRLIRLIQKREEKERND
jgi:tetratricopeptide (TPR) repeat protein